MTRAERYRTLEGYELALLTEGPLSAVEWMLDNKPHFAFWEQKEIFSDAYLESGASAVSHNYEIAESAIRAQSSDLKALCARVLVRDKEEDLYSLLMSLVVSVRELSSKLWRNFEENKKGAITALGFFHYCLDNDLVKDQKVRVEIKHTLAYLYYRAPGRNQHYCVRSVIQSESYLLLRYLEAAIEEAKKPTLGKFTGSVMGPLYTTACLEMLLPQPHSEEALVSSLVYFERNMTGEEVIRQLSQFDVTRGELLRSARKALKALKERRESGELSGCYARLENLLSFICLRGI